MSYAQTNYLLFLLSLCVLGLCVWNLVLVRWSERLQKRIEELEEKE